MDPRKLDSKNTPARWRIIGKDLIENDPTHLAELEPGYRAVLEKAADYASREEFGIGNQPDVGSEAKPVPVLVKTVDLTGPIDQETLAVGDDLVFGVTVAPVEAANKTVTWTSSDTGIATVTAAGKVTGVAVGTVKITVQANDSNGAKSSTKIIVVA